MLAFLSPFSISTSFLTSSIFPSSTAPPSIILMAISAPEALCFPRQTLPNEPSPSLFNRVKEEEGSERDHWKEELTCVVWETLKGEEMPEEEEEEEAAGGEREEEAE